MKTEKPKPVKKHPYRRYPAPGEIEAMREYNRKKIGSWPK